MLSYCTVDGSIVLINRTAALPAVQLKINYKSTGLKSIGEKANAQRIFQFQTALPFTIINIAFIHD